MGHLRPACQLYCHWFYLVKVFYFTGTLCRSIHTSGTFLKFYGCLKCSIQYFQACFTAGMVSFYVSCLKNPLRYWKNDKYIQCNFFALFTTKQNLTCMLFSESYMTKILQLRPESQSTFLHIACLIFHIVCGKLKVNETVVCDILELETLFYNLTLLWMTPET